MRTHLLLLTIAFLLCLGLPASAEDIHENAGTSAFTFLKINSGARAVGLGGAFTGVADDENALYYNPAGVATLERQGVILGYHNYFAGMQSGMIGYVRPFQRDHMISAYISYLNYGDFIETDQLGNINGEFSGGDLLLGLSFATRQSDHILLGATAKLIYEKIQEFSATGVALDLGVKYRGDRDRITFGAMIQNLGTQLSNFTDAEKDDLPLTFRIGGGARLRGIPIQFAADLIAPTDNDLQIAFGGEFYDLSPLLLRMGWNSFGSNYRATNSDDNAAGFSFGVGFEWNKKQISYAYSPAAELGESHRITLTGAI